MNSQNFSTSFTVEQSPEEAFAAINNVRGWWSEEIEGSTDLLGEVFNYHFQDVHRCTIQITALDANKKVVWHVVDNHFSFTKDQSEWKNTDIVFEIAKKGALTEVRFTHLGLIPAYECFNVCSEAWGTYTNSLRNLIVIGKGHPNAGQAITEGERALGDQSFTRIFTLDQTPDEVYAAINNVRAWWSGEIEGNTTQLGDEFTYRYADSHYSKQKVALVVPGKKVVWHVIDAQLNFTQDKTEWIGTNITFEIAKKGDETEVRFTHAGLVPQLECFNDCSNAWDFYLKDGLCRLIIAA